MKAYLLYADREWKNTGRYYDENAIVQDLGLDTLFQISAKELIHEDGKVKAVETTDLYLRDTMKKVMMVPLISREEILYRQEILKDCFQDEELIRELYDLSGQILLSWDKLGRRVSTRVGSRNTPRSLVTEIHILQLFVDSLSRMKGLLEEHKDRIKSRGLRNLTKRLREEFSDELEKGMRKILKNISFFASEEKEGGHINQRIEKKPRLVFGFRLKEGLKLSGLSLEDVESFDRRYRDPNSTISLAQGYYHALKGTSFPVQQGTTLAQQMDQLEYEIVRYVVSSCQPFYDAFFAFFDQIYLQTAFYRGAVNLRHFVERFKMSLCFPEVSESGELIFEDLREVVMGVEQRILPVGNSCRIEDIPLLVITGANQGGKSTFLRSIGIAQVMMQCGLPVAAGAFKSGIYPAFFTHFTRREDSAMNSGRLDEELSRMSQIVDHLEKEGNMVLLNESFASTTEKEGSLIAYDITRALTEAGVKVLTVTHLLSYAQRVFEETEGGESSGRAVFLTAERMENGKRTFRMIRHAPELTSFGLDLYDQLIPDQNQLDSDLRSLV